MWLGGGSERLRTPPALFIAADHRFFTKSHVTKSHAGVDDFMARCDFVESAGEDKQVRYEDDTGLTR